MNRFLYIICTLCFSLQSIGQDLPTKMEVDSIYEELCNEGLYTNASNYIVDYAIKLSESGDKKNALDYQLRNCTLIEKHIDFFRENGLTLDNYYANWEVVSILYRDLGYTDKCIELYLKIIKCMKIDAPDLIPSYAKIIAPTLARCTNEEFSDSIYSLSAAMDVICNMPLKKENIKDFIWLTFCFNTNRFYNSYDETDKLINHKIEECDSWFNKYNWFIDQLDTTVYKDEIVKYYTQSVNELIIYSSSISTQENDYNKAISIQNKCISYLKKIEHLNDTIPLKIASLYAMCATNYRYIGDIAMSQEYSDKTLCYIPHLKENYEYCQILAQLADNFWHTNQPEVAASLKKLEVNVRKKTEIPPSVSDYSLLMTYNQNDTIGNIFMGEALENKYGMSHSSMCSVYLYIADSYSKLMHSNLKKENNIAATKCKDLYEKYISKAKKAIDIYDEYMVVNNLKQYTYGNYYSTISSHQGRLGNLKESFYYAEKALQAREKVGGDIKYYDVALKAAAIHDGNAIKKYIPSFYQGLVQELKTILPLLGSVESDAYLMHGTHPLYAIPEWAAWNPQDTTCLALAYNVALISKQLYLQSTNFAPYIGDDISLNREYMRLKEKQDSIYLIDNDIEYFSALLDYEFSERSLRKKIVNKLIPSVFVKWQDVREKLDEGEVAIEFVDYMQDCYNWIKRPNIKNHYIALIIEKNRDCPFLVDLFDEDILWDVFNLQPKSYEKSVGKELYKILWGKLSPYIAKAKNIYFSPSGVMNLINIESLCDEDDIPASIKYPLYRVSSTKDIQHQKALCRINNIALYGGINYTKKDNYSFTIDSLNTRGNWAYLSSTTSEITNIRTKTIDINKKAIVTSYSGEKATEDSFKKLSQSSTNVIHLATHGFYIPQKKRMKIPYYECDETKKYPNNFIYSGLVLSGGQDSWNFSKFRLNCDDGILTSYEISKLNLSNVDLVVLSACETGIGDKSYDGIIGLHRAFKNAGVKTIIMSLWKVDDYTTSLLMTHFYDVFLKTGDKYKAFKEAQRLVRQKYPDPFYWASFIILD